MRAVLPIVATLLLGLLLALVTPTARAQNEGPGAFPDQDQPTADQYGLPPLDAKRRSQRGAAGASGGAGESTGADSEADGQSGTGSGAARSDGGGGDNGDAGANGFQDNRAVATSGAALAAAARGQTALRPEDVDGPRGVPHTPLAVDGSARKSTEALARWAPEGTANVIAVVVAALAAVGLITLAAVLAVRHRRTAMNGRV